MKAKAGVAGGGWGKNGAGDSVREVRMDNTGQVCELGVIDLNLRYEAFLIANCFEHLKV